MHARRLILAAGLAASLVAISPALAQPPAPPPGSKIVVKTQDDLPRHTYTIEGKVADFLVSDAPFRAFVEQVKKDALADLEKYHIEDETTLQGYYTLLQQIAMFEGRDEDALALVEKVHELESKESRKLVTGLVLSALVATRQVNPDPARFGETFEAALLKRVRILPWEKVREEIIQARGRAQIISRDLILGSLASQLDPVLEQNQGKASGDMVRGLIAARVTLDQLIPLQPHVAKVYGALIDERAAKKSEDRWTPNQVALSASEPGLSPVVAAVWDSGVDVDIFKSKLYVNPGEKVDGEDEDGNGFVDDVHGIAYDLESNPIPQLLVPLDELESEPSVVKKFTKGFSDLNAGVESPEAAALRSHLSQLKADQVKSFMEDLGLYGNHSHGTHVAGIMAAGNPAVRLLPVRITFDFRTIPQITPSVEDAKKGAKAALDSVKYMKSAGVRVVNMSWGGSRQGIESALEMKGVGKTSEERAALSREIFKIGRDAMEQAIISAPEILFVAAAGNSDDDNAFAEMIPSGLSAPNLITVGAVDPAGKPTNFTSFGKNVRLYANGFEVDSYVPGGETMKFSGTSMAAPQVANLVSKMLAINPSLTTPQVIEMLTRGADPLEGHEGRFVINPKKTLELVRESR